jgi:PAS domain S-box-containing protein
MTTEINVLLLEDNQTDADLIGHLLKTAGFKASIRRVETQEAYEGELSCTDFDVIIADYSLPSFDGISALKIAAKRGCVTPFIFFTGTLGEEAAVEALQNGAADYIVKQRPQRLGSAIHRAIKERRQKEKHREAEAQIRTLIRLLDMASDAVIMRDMSDTILFWNQGATGVYQYDREEALGRDVKELIYPADGLAAFYEAKRKTETDGQWVGELTQRSKDGSLITSSSRWTLMRSDSGLPERILVINSDITDKRRLEEQFLRAQRLESIGVLASGLAHDLNNVLAPIMMGAEVIRQSELPPDTVELVDTIAKSAQRGADILKQMLTFARGGEGQRVSLKLNPLLKEISKLIRNTFPKNIQFRLEAADDLHSLGGDPTQLLQVLMNLCINSRDAMPDGGKLTITAQNAIQNDRRMVYISVCDSGTGMSPQILEKAFDPFFTTKEPGHGTGLGLPSVLRIVQTHGGTISVKSEVGVGTIFEIFLPAESGALANERYSVPKPVPKGNGEMVLVVEDEQEIRNLIAQVLLNHNYNVITAEDGNQAIIRFVENKEMIRLVVTDYMMPVVDGVSLAKAIAAVNPEVKILATSGLLERQQIPQAHAFLKKPFALDELLVVVFNVLGAGR